MSLRISSAAALLLAGCGEARPDTAEIAKVEAAQRAAAEDDGRVLCGKGEGPLARVCTVDRERRDEGLVLTLRRPDGGFRRLTVTRDGRGVVATDGAEPARVAVVGSDRIDVALGDDRFRLPATVAPVR